MADEEETYQFAFEEILKAGLVWLTENATLVTLNVQMPDSRSNAVDTALAQRTIGAENFYGPVVDPEAEEPAEDALDRRDWVLYVDGMVLQGAGNGTPACICLLSDTELLYTAPLNGDPIVSGSPVFVGIWCIKNLQPTEECTVPENYQGDEQSG